MMETAKTTEMQTTNVLNVPIGVLTMDGAVQQVNRWIAESPRARLITFANVHMLVEAQLRPEFKRALHEVDLNLPDGAPVFWLARSSAGERVEKIAGPSFMEHFLEQSSALGHKHFFYGGAPGVAHEAESRVRRLHPGIQMVGSLSPPFRALTDHEAEEVVTTINESGAEVLWVGLGCPKQEQWILDFRDRLHVKVMLAVGQALNITAGQNRRCPPVLTAMGAEWVYRLFREPRRLWKRYLVTNTLFLLFMLQQKLQQVRGRAPETGRV